MTMIDSDPFRVALLAVYENCGLLMPVYPSHDLLENFTYTLCKACDS